MARKATNLFVDKRLRASVIHAFLRRMLPPTCEVFVLDDQLGKLCTMVIMSLLASKFLVV